MGRSELRTLLTARDLATVLGLDVSTVRTLSRRGIIPSVRVGLRAIRFDPDVILERIANGGFEEPHPTKLED